MDAELVRNEICFETRYPKRYVLPPIPYMQKKQEATDTITIPSDCTMTSAHDVDKLFLPHLGITSLALQSHNHIAPASKPQAPSKWTKVKGASKILSSINTKTGISHVTVLV